ncbi:uncharacterized protein LOC110358130 isoform X2 [Columba livia]|uniref:uncharacterized protein LOC110358130 isoform X2 n=1 Tax=Columba livia TaxID=8932 RepID=UPI000A3ACD17|nr:uncharacterized protein LOC110358130 isoform X2 [Columba livia]
MTPEPLPSGRAVGARERAGVRGWRSRQQPCLRTRTQRQVRDQLRALLRAQNFSFRNLSLWRCWRRQGRRIPRSKTHKKDVESLHSLQESLTKPTEKDVETPEQTEETLSKPTEEDVEAPQSPEENVRKQPGEDVEVPQSVQESTIEDGGEEGAVDCDTPKRVQIQQTDKEGARWLGAEGDQLPAEHTVSQDKTCNSRTLKAGALENLVETLLMAFGENDFTYISIFLSTYRAFASTSTVLELLLDRCYCKLRQYSCGSSGNIQSTHFGFWQIKSRAVFCA